MGTEKISFKVRCRVDAVKPKPNVHSTSRHTVSTAGNAAGGLSFGISFVRAMRSCLEPTLDGRVWCNVGRRGASRLGYMNTWIKRRAENIQVARETERLERLVQNVRNLHTGCTVHTGNDTNFSSC